LRQVIEHVLSHAIGHTPSGGRVLLHIDGDEGSARIVVSDNGPGMSKAEIERAFDRFARHDISRDDERPLGLGMPLAKRFVVAHGGSIEMVSEPGQGTMVTIILPRG
jgi:signal transduction histidine kinase